MNITLRPGRAEDARACATICYEAFIGIAEQHNFPPNFLPLEAAVAYIAAMIANQDVYTVVAETEGRIVGSNFLWENSVIASVGPLSVDPRCQDASVGRQLMQHVMQRAEAPRFAGIRLLQAAYNGRSLALYSRLGFDVRDLLCVLHGPAIGVLPPGYSVRPAAPADAGACNQLCFRVHGHDRGRELAAAIDQGTALVAEHGGRIAAYTTQLGYLGHAVAETNAGLQALIGAAATLPEPGLLVPSRNAGLLRWCLDNGLRITAPMTLMSRGLYNEPTGAYLPSVLY